MIGTLRNAGVTPSSSGGAQASRLLRVRRRAAARRERRQHHLARQVVAARDQERREGRRAGGDQRDERSDRRSGSRPPPRARHEAPVAYVAGTGRGIPDEGDDEPRLRRARPRDVARVDRRAHRHRRAPHRASDETTCSMAATRRSQAMARAGVQPGELDAIVLSTATPDRLLPSTAVDLQAQLGATRAAAFDSRPRAPGWLYAMTVAEGLIQSGVIETALVVGVREDERHHGLAGPLDVRAVRRRRGRRGAQARAERRQSGCPGQGLRERQESTPGAAGRRGRRGRGEAGTAPQGRSGGGEEGEVLQH